MNHHYLRNALPTDRGRYLNWMKDEELRKSSFGLEQDDYENDRAWFEALMKDEETDKLVYMDFFMALGEARVIPSRDEEGTGLVSLSVSREFRGQGIEAELFAALKEKLKDKYKKLVAVDIAEETLKPAPPKERDGRFEILRILAMFMIITMHYLGNGDLLNPLSMDKSGANIAFWLVEALCFASVNVYVMISGYYSVDTRFSLRKFIKLWCEIFFYSVVIGAVCFAAGIVSFEEHANLFELQYLVFPVSNGHYWFATAYMILMLIAPFLGRGFKALNKLQHGFILICLLVFTCVFKSIFPMHMMGLEDHGCGLQWFITLYVLAAYIRLYGLPFCKTKAGSAISYVFWSVLVVPCIILMYGMENGDIGGLHFENASLLVDDYNHLLVLLSSVGLFMIFVNMKPIKGKAAALISKISACTFGVYLIHAHIYLANAWPKWLGVSAPRQAMRPVHLIASVLGIFVVCCIIDFIRQIIFNVFESLCDWALGIYYAKKEVWDYLIAGFAATVMSWLTYIIFAQYVFSFMEDTWRVLLGNAASWTITVIFAYVINRVFVFHSEKTGFKAVSKEFLEFVAARLFSFGLEEAIMFVFVTLLKWNELLVKVLIASIVVIVLNYILSKLWIFKAPAEEKKEK